MGIALQHPQSILAIRVVEPGGGPRVASLEDEYNRYLDQTFEQLGFEDSVPEGFNWLKETARVCNTVLRQYNKPLNEAEDFYLEVLARLLDAGPESKLFTQFDPKTGDVAPYFRRIVGNEASALLREESRSTLSDVSLVPGGKGDLNSREMSEDSVSKGGEQPASRQMLQEFRDTLWQVVVSKMPREEHQEMARILFDELPDLFAPRFEEDHRGIMVEKRPKITHLLKDLSARYGYSYDKLKRVMAVMESAAKDYFASQGESRHLPRVVDKQRGNDVEKPEGEEPVETPEADDDSNRDLPSRPGGVGPLRQVDWVYDRSRVFDVVLNQPARHSITIGYTFPSPITEEQANQELPAGQRGRQHGWKPYGAADGTDGEGEPVYSTYIKSVPKRQVHMFQPPKFLRERGSSQA
ncbi:MAG: hypothetical protein E6R03_00330 [Hyphomicrobiaceae bacterium]|nr:MAG: hypothetical protein E6R03_00330 [Hyphomicrobiaceae bacterium]